jgi:hypothetical protein
MTVIKISKEMNMVEAFKFLRSERRHGQRNLFVVMSESRLRGRGNKDRYAMSYSVARPVQTLEDKVFVEEMRQMLTSGIREMAFVEEHVKADRIFRDSQ